MSFGVGLASGIANGMKIGQAKKERDEMLAALEKSGGIGGATPAPRRSLPASSGPNGGSYTYDGEIGDRVEYAYKHFTNAGLSPVVAAGLVGNIMQESGPEINPAAVGDNGNAWGAAQHNGPRRRALAKYAADKGTTWQDFDTQLDFVLHEGQTTEKSAWEAISSAQTPEEAARIASNKFWRPGTPHLSRREAYATAVYNRFGAQNASKPESQQTGQAARSLTATAAAPKRWSWAKELFDKTKGQQP